MLLGMLKILEKHENRNVIESALEIIEDCEAKLTSEQKALVLKEVLHMKVGEVEAEHERCFREESKKIVDDNKYF